MLTAVTSATAYGFGANLRNTALTAACAFFLALGGFSLDDLADKNRDRKTGKKTNVHLKAGFSDRTAAFIVIGSLTAGFILALFINPAMVVPVIAVIAVLLGLSRGLLDRTFLRAFSLGALQSLYALLGGLAAGKITPGMVLTAAFLFCAMTGGRVLGDIRDLPYDRKTKTPTLPIRYGIPFSLVFLWVFELLAYAAALAVFLTGELGPGYLVCAAVIAAGGLAINIWLTLKPVPRRADVANRMSLGILGGLYVIGMILGRI